MTMNNRCNDSKTLIAQGVCPRCDGPLAELDIRTDIHSSLNFTEAFVTLECADCFTTINATYKLTGFTYSQ